MRKIIVDTSREHLMKELAGLGYEFMEPAPTPQESPVQQEGFKAGDTIMKLNSDGEQIGFPFKATESDVLRQDWFIKISTPQEEREQDYEKEGQDPLELLNYDLSGEAEEFKRDIANALTGPASKILFKAYYSLGLKRGIEQLVINEDTGDHFMLSFTIVNKNTLRPLYPMLIDRPDEGRQLSVEEKRKIAGEGWDASENWGTHFGFKPNPYPNKETYLNSKWPGDRQ